MLDQAGKLGQELPLLAVHAAVLEACIRHGDSEMDNSIVIEEIRRRGHSSSVPKSRTMRKRWDCMRQYLKSSRSEDRSHR